MSWRRRVLVAVGGILVAVLAVVGAGLALAHAAVRRVSPPLPPVETVFAVDADADLPIRLSLLNTASQRMPRSAVLEASEDPDPDAPYVMSHPAFALEWRDGRIFLIDVGMSPEAVPGFGAPIERFMGGDPIQALAPAAEQLGAAASRVAGVGFTHLHVDHTSGVSLLCTGRADALPIFQTSFQADHDNYTTRPARAQLEAAGCTEQRVLSGGPLYAVPGFPGLFAIAAGGHTPGSQIFVARVRASRGAEVTTWVFVGDIVNHIDGIRKNLSKPHFYSLLVVPESTERLEVLRRYLHVLEDEHGAALLVSHDQRQLEAAGLPVFQTLESSAVNLR